MKNKHRDSIRIAIANLECNNQWGRAQALQTLRDMLEPPVPMDTTYQEHLANHLAIEHNTSVIPLIQREPTYIDITKAVRTLRNNNDNDERFDVHGERPRALDVEFYVEVDRAVIGQIDSEVSFKHDDPTHILRPLLRPAAVRLSQGDAILHVTSVDLIDSYTPLPTLIA